MWSGRFDDPSGAFVTILLLVILVEGADFARFFICVGVNVVRGILLNTLSNGGFGGGPCDFIVGWENSFVCFVVLVCAG